MKLLALFLSVMFLAGCSSLEEWFRHDADKREFQVREDWARRGPAFDNLGFRKVNRMTPVLLGKVLLQGNAIDGMVAYDRDSGQELWRLPILNGVEAGADLVKDRLFFGASDGLFYSVSASTGKVLWTFATRSENVAEPLIDSLNGVVYFLSGANVVYALDAESGRQLWLYSRQDTSNFAIRGGSKPALKDGNLYIGFSDGTMVSLNAKTGNLQWEIPLNKNKKFRDIDANPVVDGDQIFVSGYDDKLYCLNTAKGEILWKIDGGGYYPVTILDDKIYYSTTGGEVWALSKQSGHKIWSYKVPDGIATQVKIYKGMAVFGESQGDVMFLEANKGTVMGSFDPGRGVMSTPLVDDKDNHVYFISGEANVYSLEAKWGWPRWISYLQ